MEEFRPSDDLKGATVADDLAAWPTFYNGQQPHSALAGKTPIDRVGELRPKISLSEQAWDAHNPIKRRSAPGTTAGIPSLREGNDDRTPYT